MSDCCSHENSCCLSTPNVHSCPACGAAGTSVKTLTVKSLVREHTKVSASGAYRFCPTRHCDVVYFGVEDVFRKSDVKVLVGLKETTNPTLCYCFGYSEDDIRRDLEHDGTTDIPDKIKMGTQAGLCSCEVKNPSGKCCLGEVGRAVHKWKEHRRETVDVEWHVHFR